MCYNTFQNYTNSRYLFKDRSNPFLVQYPCGYCSDCIRKLRSQYGLRAYYEAKSCFDRGGYVLFDTLTYRDDALKYFHDVNPRSILNCWDFKCFSRSDIQDFFAKLRKHLKRGVFFKLPYWKRVGRQRKLHKCYKRVSVLDPVPHSDSNLRYFLTSEYGSVLKTERPHYHVLFFSTLPIDGYSLSKYIYWSWPHGLHDGYGYKSKKYIENKRVLSNISDNGLKLIHYVSKYVSKDMYNYRKLYKRVYMSYTLGNPDWMHSYSKRLEFRRFKNQVLPFHFQSVGFGLSALDYEDPEYIDKFGAIRMPISSKGVIASIPLSTYFKRKLYYDLHKFDGRLMWLPNQRYYKVLPHRLSRSIDSFANRLHAFDDRKSLDFCRSAANYQFLLRGRLVPDLGLVDLVPVNLTESMTNNRLLYNSNSGITKFLNKGCLSDRHSYRLGNSSDIAYLHPMHEVPLNPPSGLMYVGDSYSDEFRRYGEFIDSYQDFLRLVGVQIDYNERCKERKRNRYKDLGFIYEFDFV